MPPERVADTTGSAHRIVRWVPRGPLVVMVGTLVGIIVTVALTVALVTVPRAIEWQLDPKHADWMARSHIEFATATGALYGLLVSVMLVLVTRSPICESPGVIGFKGVLSALPFAIVLEVVMFGTAPSAIQVLVVLVLVGSAVPVAILANVTRPRVERG